MVTAFGTALGCGFPSTVGTERTPDTVAEPSVAVPVVAPRPIRWWSFGGGRHMTCRNGSHSLIDDWFDQACKKSHEERAFHH